MNFRLPTPRTARLALPLGALLALMACARTPEDAGKEVAALKCECDDKKSAIRYEYQQELAGKIKSGTIKTQKQANLAEESVYKAVRVQDSICRARGKVLLTEIGIKFPRKDDRMTIENLAEALMEKCDQERREKEEKRGQVEFYKLAENLPYE